MNEELRAAFDRLDRALQDARAACAAAGVPCPEEEKPTVSFLINHPPESWVLDAVTDINVSPDGDTVVTGTNPDGGTCTFRTTLTPERVRAACAREGVPCPEEEKPKTVDIISANTGGIVHLHDLRPIEALIEALIDPEHGPCLRVNGYVTKAPISDIRKQAAEAGIDLPPVTVRAVREWTSIGRVEVKAASNDGLFCTVRGASDGRYVVQEFAPEVAEVLALCALAGWPKPEVRMVCTYCDGDPCEVAPNNISGVGIARHATTIETNAPLADGSCVHHVREPVAVVQRMIDACREGE